MTVMKCQKCNGFWYIVFGIDNIAAKINSLLVAAISKKHGNKAQAKSGDHIA